MKVQFAGSHVSSGETRNEDEKLRLQKSRLTAFRETLENAFQKKSLAQRPPVRSAVRGLIVLEAKTKGVQHKVI